MRPGPGIKPGTHWWKASAFTTAPSLQVDTIGTRESVPVFVGGWDRIMCPITPGLINGWQLMIGNPVDQSISVNDN